MLWIERLEVRNFFPDSTRQTAECVGGLSLAWGGGITIVIVKDGFLLPKLPQTPACLSAVFWD